MKARSEGNDIITNVIPPISSLHNYLTFSIQIIKFQRCSCKLSFLLPPYPQSTPENLLIGCYSLNNYLFISTYNHILLSLGISTSTFMLYYCIISNYFKHIMYMGAVHVVSQMLVLVHRLLWRSIHYNMHTYSDSNFIKRTFLDKFPPTWNHACLLTNKYTVHVIFDKTRQFLHGMT